MNKISAVYKIVNTVTGDFYVGSSVDVKRRWASHRWSSKWEQCPNNPMYQDFQKYGLNKFRFQILAPVMPEHLKQVEQEFIEMLNPTYNNANAKGFDVERQKERHRRYSRSDKGKKTRRKAQKKYKSQLCSYNGEELTLSALETRFKRAGAEHPTVEAKKYLIGN